MRRQGQQQLLLSYELSRNSGAASTHSCCCCVKLEVLWGHVWSLEFSTVPPESASLSAQLTEAVQPSSSVAFYLLLL